MRRMSEWRQLLTGTSMMRYFPPMGTAGFDRFNVKGKRRLPRPPPRITPITSCMVETLARSMPDVRSILFQKVERGERASERVRGEVATAFPPAAARRPAAAEV